ncbi:Type IV fimbrial biogenesis protein PilY1 [Cupriavidus sp. U2]|uniref:pilus assembly protein n=1 Tax=Cupriavidus sp. U2 TaxID=2920269 RepID=UPI00129D734E|nr:PilC/PilY family type IV pilus protein [Cupriavidus sp. U2]KAI3591225.1 Type IV fimbrial biogenesis protein PilY1 [Cupriavidus sp. U2]
MRISSLCLALALSLATAASPSLAEDIDLYTGLQPQAGKPNVLIILDNASTWDASASFTCSTDGVVSSNNAGKDVGALQCALYNAINSITTSPTLYGNINIGLMMFGTGNNAGGKMRYPGAAPYKLPLMDNNGISAFLAYLKSIDRQADNSNNSQVGGAMQEAWAFFSGNTGLSGTKYTSPIDNPCQRNFIIYIGNAVNNGKPQDTGQNAFDSLVSAGATKAQQQEIVLATNAKYQSSWGDEWARFLNQTDVLGNMDNRQNVTTYTIAVTDNNNPDYVQLAQSMGTNGGGKSYTVQLGDANGLAADLISIFNEVQAVNSVFASVSLPASVNAQGQFLNQVYIGMFRPDATAAPRWMGNLKQYKVGYDKTGKLVMQDATGASAISNAQTGFVSANAVSFWTADAPLSFSGGKYGGTVKNWPSTGYWQNSPSGTGWKLDTPDGEIVEKGGVGEMMRVQWLTSQDSRTLLTCNGVGNCPVSAAFPSFDASNSWLTGSTGLAAFNGGTNGGATITATELPKLIAWMRGQDEAAVDSKSIAGIESETGPGSPVTVRSSIHADVLHSRPAVVNYGGTTGVVVFYGTNDGVFHAVNGNQTQGIGTVRPGGELWGFVAPEFLDRLSRLYTNSPEVKLSTAPAGISPEPKPRDYFFDGSTTVMQDQRDPANPRVMLYLTARRGGRLVYALDVTNPASPRFVWKRSNADIPELGQTWSQPKVARVRGNTNPVIIMGAGYDPAEDSDPSPGVDTMGRGVLVLDAYTGNMVWSAQPSCMGATGACTAVPALTRSIPSDVTTLDRNGDGYVERIYVGDVGGNVWRADFETAGGTAPANWTMNKLAALGGAANTNSARKFFYAPDVISTRGYDAVSLGSGDREHPLYSASATPGTAYNVVNRLYMIRDTNTSRMPSTWTPLTEASLVDATTAGYDGSRSGFYITLVNPGEKAVNAPLTVAGYTSVGTNTPSVPKAGVCYPNLGTARSYSYSFLTSAGLNPDRSIILDGGGFPPSPVFGVVSVDKDGQPVVVPVLFGVGNQNSSAGGDDKSALGVQKVSLTGVGKRKRIYWYPETDQK